MGLLIGRKPVFLYGLRDIVMSDMENITQLVEKSLNSLGYEVIELKLIKAGPRKIVRVFIDKEGGITVADCKMASNNISELLDNENFLENAYTLEVSSPGIDRPLITAKDFIRVIDKDIRIRLKKSKKKNKTVHGKLINCINGNIQLNTGKEEVTIPISNIYSGKIEITFK